MVTIGVTCHAPDAQDSANLQLLVEQIADAVRRAGAEPVLISPDLDETALRERYAAFDGLILSGGGDVAPACYAAARTPAVDGVDPNRDRTEIALAQWALAEQKPLLGICRGLQLLNVACGGSLYQDMSQSPATLPHALYPDLPFDLLAHPVTVAPDSRLAAIVGAVLFGVNSLHHQACDTVAPTLRVVAHAPDGTVEAVEAPAHPFALAVQWHPEALPAAPESSALFRALVAASAGDASQLPTVPA
jgi:putative glutamine amidotransferase